MTTPSLHLKVVQKHLGGEIQLKGVTPVAGGCINQTSQLKTNNGDYFLKVNSSSLIDMFEKEAQGLQILADNSPLSVPSVFGHGIEANQSYLLLSWIEKGPQTAAFWTQFGDRLAKQHQVSTTRHGLDHDNHIGRLPQSNTKHASWHEFFIEERLKPQLKLATDTQLVSSSLRNQFDSLFRKLEDLIPNESPALLHGDLWSGNFVSGASDTPFVVDPAVHYGHRETEIAFTTMFGGFDQTFYQAYQNQYPLQPNFEERIEIHNLYPLLVHVNLFGSSYLSGIISTLKRLT